MKQHIIRTGELLDSVEVIELPEPDTSLHIMGGVPSKTPEWVIDGWKRATEERKNSGSLK